MAKKKTELHFKEFYRSLRMIYEVSSLGEVRSVKIKDGTTRTLKATTRKTCKEDKTGYFVVGFKVGPKKNCTRYVHRLVMESFGGSAPGVSYEVNHIDGNKLNNNISNLEWVTRSQNMKEAYRLGLIKKSDISGAKNPNWKGGLWQRKSPSSHA